MRSKKNNLIIVGLCSILVLMGIGYARSLGGVRPVVTLSPEVKITGGNGSSTNAYQLSL